jgi:hypothetical protein
MTTETISLSDFLAFGRDENCRRVGSQSFMKKVIEPGSGLVGSLDNKITVWQVAFDTGKLFMVGLLPAIANMFHTVASDAEAGASRSVIADSGEYRNKDAYYNASCYD